MPGDGDGDVLGGMLGDEKLRLPRLPDELPPPALAHAALSSTMLIPKIRTTERTRANIPLLLISTLLVKI